MGSSTANHERVSSSTHRPPLSPPKWVTDIKNHLNKEPLHNSGEVCAITRVPPSMHMVEENDYIPKLVSIGPFHRNNSSLQAMEAHKLRFLYGLLDPNGQKFWSVESSVRNWRVQNVTLDGLEKAMKELEWKTRESYSEKFDGLSSDEFVRMMVIDGSFIVELLRLVVMTYKENIDDPIFSTRFMLPFLRLDLLMLENQLPLFVLQKLYTLTGPDQNEASFNYLAIKFFNPLVPLREEKTIDHNNVAAKQHKHLLALFQSNFITNKTQNLSNVEPGKVPEKPKTKWFSSATELCQYGILFKKNNRGCFLEIKFKERVLTIPTLFFDDNTTRFLRNAMAYEQCERSAIPYFTTLVIFFNALVDSAEDVKILRRAGIIETPYGSEDVADMINKLAKGIVFEMGECYILEVVKNINRFTQNRWNSWRAKMERDYSMKMDLINLCCLLPCQYQGYCCFSSSNN